MFCCAGGDAYIKSSQHWAWSVAFTAATAGPDLHNVSTATATAPQMPTHDQAAAAWACLAACWCIHQLVQQQHEAAVSTAHQGIGADEAGADTALLLAALQALSSKTITEADAAEVQFVASAALAEACKAAYSAAKAAAAALQDVQQSQQTPHAAAEGPQASAANTAIPAELHALQARLAGLQAAMTAYEQSGLAFVLDPSTSDLTEELPEAALSLEELLDAGDTEQAAAMLEAQQQQPTGKHWQQQLAAASAQLQLLAQLLVAIQYEALGPIAAWQAAAVAQPGGSPATPGTPKVIGQQQQDLVLLPAGAVSQKHLWHAAAAHVKQHWQQLQQLLAQAVELEGHMHALAAVAAAGGAAAIWPEDADLMSQAISLQQMLLPQGFDILITDECVASAQLLQAQWTDLEQRLWLGLAEALCPMLGVEAAQAQQHGTLAHTATVASQDAGAGVVVLRQLLDAAGASIAGGSILHCRDVLEALAAGGTGGTGSTSSTSSSMWGVPGMSDAWRALVVLLLQYGCLQQQLLRTQQAQDYDSGSHPAAVGADGAVVVLQSRKALPLEVEAQRPLFVVVQALHELLLGTLPQTAAVAAGPSVCLQQQLQGILLAPFLQLVLPAVDKNLQSLQQHLSVLAAEAGGVLARYQNRGDDSGPATPRPRSAAAAVQEFVEGSSAAAGDEDDLVPFDAFDMLLPGADMLLEELGSDNSSDTGAAAGLDGDQHSSTQGSNAAASAAAVGLSDLVPFDDFDEGLAGAGMMLEEGGGLEGGGADAGGFFGALDDESDLLGGALEDGDQPAGAPAGALARASALQDRHTDGQVGALGAGRAFGAAEAEAKALAQQLMAVGQNAAAALLQQQELEALQQVQGSCEWQQQVWLRHLSAFEWLWGDMLSIQGADSSAGVDASAAQQQQLVHAAAAALGIQVQAAVAVDAVPGHAYQLFCVGLMQQLPPQPSPQARTSGSGGGQEQQQQRMPITLELLQTWQVLCEHQAALADALQSWQAARAAAAGAVADVLFGAGLSGTPALQVSDPSVCRKVGLLVTGLHLNRRNCARHRVVYRRAPAHRRYVLANLLIECG